MKQLKTFFYSLKRSAYDASYYKDILKVPFSFSLKYLYMFSVLMVLIAVLQIGILAGVGSFKLPNVMQQIKAGIATAYPPELVIRVQNGTLSTNVTEPYYIDPFNMKDMGKDGSYEHVITIDTQASVEDYARYRTGVLVTAHAIAYPDRNNGENSLHGYKVMPFEASNKPFMLNKAGYDGLVTKVMPFVDALPLILAVLFIFALILAPWIGGLFGMIGQLIYLLFVSLIVWAVASMFKLNLRYSQVYQLSMHGITLPTIFIFLMGLFDFHQPFLFTAAFLLWMVYVLMQMEKKESVS